MRSYHAHCQNCDYTSSETVGGVPALILDTPSDDPDADPEDPRLILLDDLQGRATIARSGYTFTSATLTGRYLRIRDFFCVKCGCLYQQRALAPAFAQLFWHLWVIVALPFVVFFFLISPDIIRGIVNGLFFGFMAGGASLALLDPLYRMYLRWRYSSCRSAFETKAGCPACGSKSKAIPGLYQGTIRCPKCKMETMRIKAVDTARAAESGKDHHR